MVLFLGVLLWCGLGFIAYGGVFAYLQRESTPIAATHFRKSDKMTASFVGLFGPFGLLFALVACGWLKHGFKFS